MRTWFRSNNRPRVHDTNARVAVAEAARDAKRFREAEALYCEALAGGASDRASLLIQAGHMAKESRQFDRAESHYSAALSLLPNDAELALQLGHFYKTIGRIDEALAQYRRASRLAPAWIETSREAAALDALFDMPPVVDDTADPDVSVLSELLPQPVKPRPVGTLDEIQLYRFGRRHEWTRWGMLPTFSGVDAVRGACHSDEILVEVRFILSRETLFTEPLVSVPTVLGGITKTVFNLWIDLSGAVPGPYMCELVLKGESGREIRRAMPILIEPPIVEEAGNGSDGYVPLSNGKGQTITDRVRSLPSVVRPANRQFLDVPDRIAVLRTDQLGDMIVSIPALRRLREIFPHAHIVGLVTEANGAFAETLGLFDEILPIDFPDDFERRQRTMSREVQDALRSRLAAYKFDLAIDLATSHMSRAVLRLTGAKAVFGFDDHVRPWMSGGVSGGARDPMNGQEAAPQSGRILAMIERIATLVDSGARILRRLDLECISHLGLVGLPSGSAYAVLHAGARIAFSRWQGFPELAKKLLAETDLAVLLFADDPAIVATLPSDLAENPRFRLIREALSFDEFDALLSFATVFVGNDSGPKHLAALRGTPTVSVHSARISWGEWAQENAGLVVSRRVPCAGCAIFHDPDDCGKDHVCISDIKVSEVFDAVRLLLDGELRGAGRGDEAGSRMGGL